MSESEVTNEDLRRALEALRNGVPNRDAVRVLGCSQTRVTESFRKQLEAVDDLALSGLQSKGMLVAGDFGSGKSHLLEYLKHIALEERFVCSVIVVSKETPFYDPVKMFAAAAESAVAESITGDAIKEIALRLDPNSEAYAGFFRWADSSASQISSHFPATLLLHERLRNDPEMNERVLGFWAGESLSIADIRAGMRQIGHGATYQLRSVAAKELPLQRFKFASKLFRAAGYRGWVILIDELELIARYSRFQRAKSYAEIARWMGLVEAAQYPGLTAVATITGDFETEALGKKGDRELVVPLLESKNTDDFRALASRAETGMREIDRKTVDLDPPDDESLLRTYITLKRIHAEAYDWSPQDVEAIRTSTTRRMRSYVRRWINQWDLQRLYPGESLRTIETELTIDYSDSAELQQLFEDSPVESLDEV